MVAVAVAAQEVCDAIGTVAVVFVVMDNCPCVGDGLALIASMPRVATVSTAALGGQAQCRLMVISLCSCCLQIHG